MSAHAQQNIFITAILLTSLVTIIAGIAIRKPINGNDDLVYAQCLNYEYDGAIPKHSCDCAKQLFSNFSESFDWIDSCGIVNARTISYRP